MQKGGDIEEERGRRGEGEERRREVMMSHRHRLPALVGCAAVGAAV